MGSTSMQDKTSLVTKLGDIPILNDTLATAWQCYSRLKDMNSLTKITLETAESSVLTAAKMSAPIINRYHPQIEMLDSFACGKLNELEVKYPAMKLSSEQVKDVCLEYVTPVMGRVKPVVASMQGVVEGGRRRVDDLRTFGCQLATCDLREVVQESLTRAMESSLLTRTADGALTYTEDLVDRFMPDLEEGNDDTKPAYCSNNGLHPNVSDTNDTTADQAILVEQMLQMPASPHRVVVHMGSVSRKLRQMLFQRAMKDFKGAKARTEEALGNLHGVVDLIDYARTNLGAARDKAEVMWTKVTSDLPEGAEPTTENFEEKIVHLGRVLTQNVTSGISAIERIFPGARQTVTHPISQSQEYRQVLMHFTSFGSLKSLSLTTLDHLHTSLTSLQIKVSSMMVEAGALDMLSVNMVDLGLEEDDISLPRAEALSQDSHMPRADTTSPGSLNQHSLEQNNSIHSSLTQENIILYSPQQEGSPQQQESPQHPGIQETKE